MSQHQPPSRPHLDRQFFIRFGVVVVGLHAIAGALWLIAVHIGGYEPDPRRERSEIAARIEPVGTVVTSPEELQKVSARSQAPGAAAAGPAQAASGEEVVQQVCGACHTAGVLGAPKTGDQAAWKQRLDQAGGLDGLVRSAIEGKNQMPPRGGAPQLSDEQIRAAVEVMLK